MDGAEGRHSLAVILKGAVVFTILGRAVAKLGAGACTYERPIIALVVFGSLAAGAGVGFPGVALAQQAQSGSSAAGDDQGPQLEEVVVTAQFRQQAAQDTPIAITAVDAKTLESRGQIMVNEIASQAPNVTLEPAPGTFGPALQAFIRGVGQADFNYASEPGVGMYVDDVYYSTLTGSIMDLLDLDHVEVLRGPQGTLAGMNSIGGAIKLYTQKPDGQGGGYVNATYGSFNRTELRAAGDFTLIPDQLFVRFSGVARHQDGYVTRYDYACTHPGANVPTAVDSSNCVLGTEGGVAYAAERVALRWRPDEALEINVTADHTGDNSEAAPSTLLYVGQVNGKTGVSAPTYPRFSSAPAGGIPLGTASGSAFIAYSPFGSYAQDATTHSPYMDYSSYCDAKPPDGTAPFCVPAVRQVSGYGIAGTVDYTPGRDISVKSITAMRYYSGVWSLDEDAAPLSDEILYNTVWHRQVSEELRLSGNLFAGAVKYTVGGFYIDQHSSYGGRIDLGSFDFIENDRFPATSKAGFLNVDWQITSALELNAGARYTKEDKTMVYGRLGVPGNTYPGGVAPQVASLNNVAGRFSGNKTDSRIALQYQWLPALMTYADVSTGFKGGGVNPRPFYAAQAISFAPETLTAYEVGIKSDWLEHRLRVNAAAFFDNYKDIQLIVNNCAFAGAQFATPCAAPINAGTAHISGAELEIQARPTRSLSVDASGSFLHFNYTSLSPLAVGSGITPGMTTPFAPRWKYSAGVQYEVFLGHFGSVTPRLDLSHQDSFYGGANNAIYNRVNGYTLLNGHLTWRDVNDAWQVALEAKNLTDRLYYYGYFDNRSSSQTVLGEPAPPREWAVSLRRNF
jgi:iron complex outermembrane recepter protein